jgi:hypothetical protein
MHTPCIALGLRRRAVDTRNHKLHIDNVTNPKSDTDDVEYDDVLSDALRQHA